MCKTLTFLRLCKVLPEDDEKQQSTINGGKVLVNERLCSLLHSRFQCRHATLLPTSGEERCVTTLKTAVQQTISLVAHLAKIGKMKRFQNFDKKPLTNLSWFMFLLAQEGFFRYRTLTTFSLLIWPKKGEIRKFQIFNSK